MKRDLFDQVIVICGPTASGKSGLAVKLAKEIDAEIVSADSMQIYRELNIGTAKVSEEIQEQVPHHLINIINPDQSYSVAQYSKQATLAIKNIISRNKRVILCGGTGLYINALLDGLLFIETPISQTLRNSITEKITENNAETWHIKLSQIDPISGQRISANNLRRIRRFFEVYESSGLTQTQIYQRSHDKGPDFKFKSFYLKPDREKLYEKINVRTEKMFDQGLISEVELLLTRYPQIRQSQSFQAIGYKETVAFLDGKVQLTDAISKIAQVTRNYAKRQYTWFNARNDLQEIENFGNDSALSMIIDSI